MIPIAMRCKRLCVLLVVVGASASCTIEETREGSAPDIDVDPGRWPQYDVKWAEVEVGTSQRTVDVPVIRIEREPRQITVPYIDIKVPGAGQADERTVSVTADVPHEGYALEIQEVRVAGDDLWVVATLMEMQDGGGTKATTRVSDRVVLNAPGDLDVRTVIVGRRPGGDNGQHRFVASMNDLDRIIPDQARVLYRRNVGA